MTTDIMKLFAKYNAIANSEMNAHLSLLTQDEWDKNLGGYYQSIHALCSHIYVADATWLKRFAALRKFTYNSDDILSESYSLNSIAFESIKEYLTKRGRLDSIITSFTDEIQQNDLEEMLHYKNFRNEDQSRNFGGLLVHVFNHQTHHRGMISLYLELLGKSNDFSNFFRVI